jgi:hypothetical protein
MEISTMKIAVVTTFHEKGLKTYAQRMIDTFCQNWPEEVTLHIYPEKCNPIIRNHAHVTLTDLDSISELTAFKEKWKDVPMATGWCNDSTQKFPDKTKRTGFKWDAVRFSHKVYAIFDCAKNIDADVLIWMDADTICHSPITLSNLEKLIPVNKDLCYLGREGKYSECGLYSINLRSPTIQGFLKEFQRMYDDAEHGIFTLDEWHDSFVFDAVRLKFKNQLQEYNWSAGIVRGEGHPLINSQWGAYLDHLKGDRKTMGRSKLSDLKIKRTEKYWQ